MSVPTGDIVSGSVSINQASVNDVAIPRVSQVVMIDMKTADTKDYGASEFSRVVSFFELKKFTYSSQSRRVEEVSKIDGFDLNSISNNSEYVIIDQIGALSKSIILVKVSARDFAFGKLFLKI